MPEVHAYLSASGSSRWLACTKSPALESKFPNNSSVFAREGTVAHSLGELFARYFIGELTEDDFETAKAELIADGDGKEFYNEEMNEHAVAYANLINSKLTDLRADCEDAFAELEVRVNFSKWVPEGFGTCDCAIVADDLLEIVDLKYGKGHRVEAAGNTQMKLYALGALEAYSALYDIKTVKMTIFQPRLSGVQSSDTITVEELLAWGETVVKPKAQLAYKGAGEYAPSEETCKFCRAKEKCKARYDHNLSLFDDREDPDLITLDEAGAVLEKAGDIKAWIQDLESLVTKSLLNGEKVEGWKMVEGRSNRKITDDLLAAEALKASGIDEALLYERKLLSLTTLEKDFGKKHVDEILAGLIVKPQGRPTLAPASDKRPEYQPEEAIMKAFDEE